MANELRRCQLVVSGRARLLPLQNGFPTTASDRHRVWRSFSDPNTVRDHVEAVLASTSGSDVRDYRTTAPASELPSLQLEIIDCFIGEGTRLGRHFPRMLIACLRGAMQGHLERGYSLPS